jgi:SAM-dependent methyltransferase
MNTNSIAAHYDEDYFVNFQKEIGEFGGKANLFLFEKHVQRSDTVVDFGCGGGFLLKNLNCREKIGIDLNEVAREYCQKAHGIKCYESLDYLEDGSIDLVISSHCLEHTTNPFEIVSLLFRKLKNKGRIVIVIPLDAYKNKWVPNDINNHLYSFSPMNLGNILQDVGFKDISTMPVLHKWPPGFEKINKFFGFKIFHFLSWIYGSINKRVVQVKGIGTKRL